MKKMTILLTFLCVVFNASALEYSPQNETNYKDDYTVLTPQKQFIDFPEQLIAYRGHTFRSKAFLSLTKDKKDFDHVLVYWWLKDVASETDKGISANTGRSDWVIELKKGKGKAVTEQKMTCIPPISPEGTWVWVKVKTKIDLRDEKKCYVKYKILDKKKATDDTSPF